MKQITKNKKSLVKKVSITFSIVFLSSFFGYLFINQNGYSWKRDHFKYIPDDYFNNAPKSESNKVQKFIIKALSAKILPPASYHVVKTKQANQIIATRGTRMDIPANAFADIRGRKITGSVALTVTEVMDPLDFVTAGVPLIFENSKGQTEYFQSAGMFHIKAKKNQSTVYLAKGKKINIQFPNIEPGDDFWVYKINDQGKWQLNGHNQSSQRKEGGVTFGTRKYDIDELNTWWNFDKPMPTIACVTGKAAWDPAAKADNYQIFSIGISYKGSFTRFKRVNEDFRVNVHKSAQARFMIIDNKGNVGITPLIRIWDKTGFDSQPEHKDNPCQKIDNIALKQLSKDILESKEALSSYLGLSVSDHKVDYQKTNK